MEPSHTESALPPRQREIGEATTLPGAVAALLGWVAVACSNAVGLFGIPLRRGAVGERLLHHVYDLGQTLTLGLCALGAVLLVGRFGPKRPLLRVALLAAVAVAVGSWLLAEDLGGAAERVAGPDVKWPLRVLCAGVALTVPVA